MTTESFGGTLRIEGVRVFDGSRSIPRAAVEVHEGIITRVEPVSGPEPSLTLLPGLIDCHTHAWGPLERVLSRNLLFGVTTVLEMMSDGDGLAEVAALRANPRSDLADIYSCGPAVTVAGGHGTEYGFDVPVVSGSDDVAEFINRRVAEGSEFIKVIHFSHPEPEKAAWRFDILETAVQRAHELGKLVAVHATTAAAARDALRAGAD